MDVITLDHVCGYIILNASISWVCMSYKNVIKLPVSRNHQGRRGTTADIGDNLLPSLTVFGCSLTAVEVETGPLSDVVFPSFLLPSSFSFPWYCALYDDLFAEAT